MLYRPFPSARIMAEFSSAYLEGARFCNANVRMAACEAILRRAMTAPSVPHDLEKANFTMPNLATQLFIPSSWSGERWHQLDGPN